MKNFRLRPPTSEELATDATVEHPLEHRGQKHCRCPKDQNDSAVQRTDRKSHPPPPERELVRHHAARYFERKDYSIYATRAKREAIERQDRTCRQEHQERQLGDLFEALPRRG